MPLLAKWTNIGVVGMARQKLFEMGNDNPAFYGANLTNNLSSKKLWATAQNVVWRDEGISSMKGWITADSTLAFSAISPIRGGFQGVVTGPTGEVERYIAYGTPKAVYTTFENGSVVANLIDAFAGTGTDATSIRPALTWSFANFGNWLVATNGQGERPFVFTNLKTLTGPTRIIFGQQGSATASNTCQVLLRHGPHVLAGNIGRNWNEIQWCTADDPTQWTASAANSAGSLVVREFNSHIIAASRLGNYSAFYSEESVALMNYVGAPFYFGYQMGPEGVGAWGKMAVVEVGGQNYGWGKQGFWVTDGVNKRYIDDPDIRRFWQKRITTLQMSKVTGWHDAENTQVIWYYPANGNLENNEGLGFDYAREAWVFYNHGFDTAVPKQSFQAPVAFHVRDQPTATAARHMYFLNTGNERIGLPDKGLKSVVNSRWLDLGDPLAIKEVHEARCYFNELSGTASLQVASLIGDQASNISTTTYALTTTQLAARIPTMKSGRFISFGVNFSGTGAMTLSKIALYGRMGGRE